MGTQRIITTTGDAPLTREDVEKLVREVGSTENVNLNGRNMQKIDLAEFDLTRAMLRGTDLREANLRGALLGGVDLSEANLSFADLSEALLQRSNLVGARLTRAKLKKTYMKGAFLIDAHLDGADLQGAKLEDAYLHFAFLNGADLSGASLLRADLRWTMLDGANLRDADLSEALLLGQDPEVMAQLRGRGAFELDSKNSWHATSSATLLLRLLEEPLTAGNLTTLLSAFTELHTKSWLVQQGRFADLMDYTQTHQPRFTQEANLRIIRLSYNSPALILFDVVSQALGTALTKTLDAILKAPKETIDAVAQAPERKEAKQLENEAAAQALEQQQHDTQFQEQLREIEVLKQRAQAELAIAQAQRQRAEEQLRTIDTYVTYSLHLVEMLQPQADPQTKAMAARALVPQLLAFGQVQGLEITLLSAPEPSQEGDPPSSPADAAP